MKGFFAVVGSLVLFLSCHLINAEEPPQDKNNFTIDNLKLEGEITDDDNITFMLTFSAETTSAGSIVMAQGKITELSSEVSVKGSGFLWLGGGEFKTVFKDGAYVLECLEPGKCEVKFSFAAKVEDAPSIMPLNNAKTQIMPPAEIKKGIKTCSFALAPAIARSIQIRSPRKDMDLAINGGLNLEKKDVPGADAAIFTAVLPPEGDLRMNWRSQVEKISATLVTSVQATTVAEVFPGTVKLNSLFMYSVIQGRLSSPEIRISQGLNILSVSGENIQDWKISEDKENGNMLVVTLSKYYEDSYAVSVESEKILPDFPSKFSLPSVVPLKALRLDGYLAFGTNGAIKLIVDKTSGLNQIDNSSFPAVDNRRRSKELPRKSLFTYKFSGEKYSLDTSADNIMPNYTVDLNYVLTFKDEDLLLRANCSLDIKDAPLRELLIRYSNDVTVNRVEGRSTLSDDYETFEKDGKKWLKIPFAPDTTGKTDVFINFEKSMKNLQSTQIPAIFIESAKSVRGHILLAANRGLSLIVEDRDLKNLRKYPTGSAPLREPGLQHNLRFKDQDWEGKVTVVHEQVNMVSEVFHIGSVGEGTIYGSSIFTYHVSGAPMDKIQLKINPSVKNLEFTGGNIIDWKLLEDNLESQTWQVNFKEKIFGDYTLLATYETPLIGAETKYRMGDLSTVGAGAETGFIALTSARNLKVSAGKISEAVIEIESSELPDEYKVFLQNPILKAYRFTLTPHWIDMNISGYASQQMISIAVDHAKFTTRIDRNGQAVTTAEYRIKNSSLQFLSMELPAKSELWTVKVNGEKKRISSSAGKYLVPLPRNKNTDDPISVEITYAEKNGELGKSAELKLSAPVLSLETMFSRWTVEVPENYNLTEYGGNMMPMRNPQRIGLGGILARFSVWLNRLMNPLIVVPWLALTLIGAALVWSWTKGSLKILVTTVSVLVIGIILIASLGFLERKMHRAVPEFLPEPVNSCEFTRLFSLPQDTPKIEIYMSDMKASSFLKAGFAFVMAAFGLVLLGIGAFSSDRIRQPLLIASGTVFLLYALSQWLYLNAIIAFALASVIPLLLTIIFWRMVFRRCRSAVAACLILCLCLPLSSQAAGEITIEDVNFKISAAVTDNDKVITGTAHYRIKADKGASIVFLPAPAVLTGGTPKISGLEIIRNGNNYMVKADSSGEYEFEVGFLLPVVEERSGNFHFPLAIPPCLRNSTEVRTNRENIEITSPEAVFFKAVTENNVCKAQANFVPGASVSFKFKPQVRKIEKEKTVLFTSIDALAKFASGFVEIKYYLNFQVAQGETAKFAVEVPENMRVTSVSAPDLGAWRFVEENHLLEVFLSQPHHGNFTALVVTQIANCNLPYETRIGTLSVKDAGKQYGTLGVGADSNVQVLVDDKLDGFNSINLNDFIAKFADAGPTLKKAFRYNKPPASIAVKASAVEPELRVKENYTVSFEEEKTVLTSDLNLEIAKAGIFSVTLDIPENYEIDKVTGSDVQHWDEISEKGVHRILVHFDKSICGTTSIHLELSISERKREKAMTIPKITVAGAQKNKGDLTISLERGTRMDVVSRQGLEIKTEGFAQNRDRSAQRFSIVRADWELKVSFDVIAPWVQAEVLQIGKVTEGVVEYDAYFHYSIENAGVKSFRIRLPENAGTPEFSGENTADPKDLGKNLWEIELHQKVSGKYMLQAHYRIPYEKNTQVKIAPVVTEGTELQKGYLAVLSNDSLQVKLSDRKGEISEFDVRKIPAYFKVDYLSNAVMCFRTVGNDYSVILDAVRHKTADQLKAQIRNVNISSVVSPEGRVITSAQVSLINGNQNFLEMKLPEGSTLWSVLIDNQAVDVAQEKGNLLIPLRQGLSGAGRDQNIEIIYSLETAKSWSAKNQIYNGPSFNLPLRNVSWNLYLPKDFEYSKFRGTLDYFDREMAGLTYINLEDYDKGNERYNSENKKNAKAMLNEANRFAASGKKREAFEYFQSASNLSLNDAELNADVKGQWQQVQRDNSIQGLFSRRTAQKKGKSISQDEMANAPVQQAVQTEDLNAIKQQLGGTEVTHLQTISDKIFLQQQQAAAVPHPLRLTIPEGGTKLEFRRALEVTPFAPTQISFKAKKNVSWRDFSEVYAGLVIILGLAVLIMIVKPAGRKESADMQ
ncbi:MAG TPA: hypothetical protein DET40_09475 [Lentisphaeria bacterium]|nr:MAG: hypothetical protein A2X45_08265 [Lentisphaerae bacterium GWF2_50_93]HCE43766.1 hypothetical protein [Lentisphaeria bacterium]